MARESIEKTREALIAAGATALADELLRLRTHSEEVDAAVGRLTASSAERQKRFRSGLAGLRRGRRFVPWSQAREFAARLESLLEELRTSNCDPEDGVELVGRFFECDEAVLGRSDDSSGIIADVFQWNARDLWVAFASRCEEKDRVLDRLVELLGDDDYGVRDCLLGVADQYLDEAQLRSLVDRLWDEARQDDKDHWYRLSGIVARLLVDPGLYEKSIVASCGGEVGGHYLEIARLYLEAGSPTDALRWLESSGPARHRAHAHDKLLLEVHAQLGQLEQQAEVALRIFESGPSLDKLDQLVAVVGENRRAALVDEVQKRMAQGPLSLSGAGFLLDVGRARAADAHIIEWRSDLDGDFYPTLLDLAKRLEAEELLLSTTCLYRALLDSILGRGVSRYYHHGARYLKKLDQLATQLQKWEPLQPHEIYRAQLLQRHGRKRSFWAKAEAAGQG